MTKKDFILIAEVLHRLIEDHGHCFDSVEDCKAIVRRFSEALVKTNERFDASRFELYALNGKKIGSKFGPVA